MNLVPAAPGFGVNTGPRYSEAKQFTKEDRQAKIQFYGGRLIFFINIQQAKKKRPKHY